MTTSGPPMTLTGLRRETRDRIRAAVVNSGEQWPTQEIAVSLPEGSSADLAIAVSVLAAEGTVPATALAGVMFLAELGLDGSLRLVPGVLPAVNAAAEGGMDTVVVAAGDAALVPGMRVIAACGLAGLMAWLRAGSHDSKLCREWLSASRCSKPCIRGPVLRWTHRPRIVSGIPARCCR
jgi:magnesium chelatase family protein